VDTVAAANLPVLARSRDHRTLTNSDGRFRIEGLEPGPATVVSYDGLGRAAVVSTVVVGGATTDLGEVPLQIANDTFTNLRGFGLEERITNDPIDITQIISLDGLTAYTLTFPWTATLLQIDLDTGALRVAVAAPVNEPGPNPFELETLNDRSLIAWGSTQSVWMNVSSATTEVFDTPGHWKVRWRSGPRVYFLRPDPLSGSPAGNAFSIQRIADDDGFSNISRQLFGGRSLLDAAAIATDANGDTFYVPFLDCTLPAQCTPQEIADVAAGLRPVVRLGWRDGTEMPIAQISGLDSASMASAVGHSGFYLAHQGVLTRVDIASGAVQQIAVPFDVVNGTRALSLDAAETGLLLFFESQIRLVDLPGPGVHDLTLPNLTCDGALNCCPGIPRAEFLPNGQVRVVCVSENPNAPVAVWMNFSRSGDLLRGRGTRFQHIQGTPDTPPPLLTRSDGLEITVGLAPNGLPQSVLVADPGTGSIPFHQLTMVGVPHTSPFLSRDGSVVYYLMTHKLFRMQLP